MSPPSRLTTPDFVAALAKDWAIGSFAAANQQKDAMPNLLYRPSIRTARIAGRRRRLALTLGALGGALLILAAAVWSQSATGSTASQRRLPRSGVARIPLAAESAISAALGREQSGYRLVGLRARNWTQRFGAAFSRDGARIDSGSAHVGLRLLTYGRDGAMRLAGRVSPRVSANRVDYARPGVDEWYSNGPLGLEQGFDVSARPPAARGPLTLALELSGNLCARLVRSGVLLEGAAGSLRYGGLSASDARGRRVRSWLELRSGRLLIKVDDRHAAYPLRIDPLVQQAQLTASDGAAMDFFSAAAVSPDTIAVGAPGHSVAGNDAQGAVYVFQKPASGWAHATQSAELTVSGGAAEDSLGGSVAISGDTIFAGAANRTVDANSRQGAVYVFVKPASGWKDTTQTAELVASDGRGGDSLGAAVAASGDTVVAAADDHAVGNNVEQGEGYVFVKPASGWENSNESAILISSDGAAGDFLGESVAISGDTIALGALNHKVGANEDQGSAYLYTKPAAGWGQTKGNTETTELTATDGAAGDHLGSAVAIAGDTVFAGAVGHHVGLNRQGAAYVFAKPFGGWNPDAGQTAELTASDGATDDLFGLSLAASGDSVLVGAPLHDVGPNGQGVAYLFTRPGATWTSAHQTEEVTASGGTPGDGFGFKVGLAGNLAVAGSIQTVAGNVGQGAAYLFALPPEISLASPADGATYTQNSIVLASFSCATPAGATITACAAPSQDGAPVDTSRLGRHTYTVAASDSDGVAATQSVSYAVIPSRPVGAGTAGPPTSNKPRLSITAVRQSASVWRLGSTVPRIARRLLPVGTTFSFVLSQPARATLSFTRASPGRSVHGKCAAQTVRNTRQPRCTRSIAVGTLTLNGHRGVNRVRFQGRLARDTTLRPGRYAMAIVATTAAGQRTNSRPLHFTVAK